MMWMLGWIKEGWISFRTSKHCNCLSTSSTTTERGILVKSSSPVVYTSVLVDHLCFLKRLAGKMLWQMLH